VGRKGRKSKDGASENQIHISEVSSVEAHSSDVTSLAVHATGDYLLTTSLDGSWCFLDVAAATCLRKVPSRVGSTEELFCGQLHPDGLILGTGTNSGLLKIWDVREQKCVAEFAAVAAEAKTTSATVRCVSFSENGYLLASGADDGGAKIWDLRKLKCTRNLECEFISKLNCNQSMHRYRATNIVNSFAVNNPNPNFFLYS
jgi:pre-mRNA-processing factor 19